MSGVLEGVRVLDFGRYIAGPYCACLLGDMGAEVIRIEKLTGSEDRYIASIGSGGEGALYVTVNRNKKSMTLNPTKPAGREVVKKLVATADVVVANLPPATLQQMGLDYDTLVLSKPDIILTTANAFGSGGPYSNRVGFDGIGQVMCGNAYLSGEDGTPTKAWVPWVDFGTASLSAFGTLAALMSRAQTGKGQKVEGALLKTALTFMNATMVEQAVTQINRKATGNRGQNAAPSDTFQTKDGWIISQVIGQPLYERWAKLMGEEHWLTDARFKDDDSRGVHGEVISARMSAWCAQRTTEEVLQALEVARRHWRTRISKPWGSCSPPSIPVCRNPPPWPISRSRSATRQAASVCVLPCSGNIRMKSCAAWATMPRRLLPCGSSGLSECDRGYKKPYNLPALSRVILRCASAPRLPRSC
jgi:crotonobetainyl-CoA:carnitine CoA-transferase CaiB-like acyl-CoA transferase